METRISWEQTLNWKTVSSRLPWRQGWGHFLNDWWEKIQPTVGNASSVLVVLGHKESRLSKPWEWASKHLPSRILESLILFHLLQWLPHMIDCVLDDLETGVWLAGCVSYVSCHCGKIFKKNLKEGKVDWSSRLHGVVPWGGKPWQPELDAALPSISQTGREGSVCRSACILFIWHGN